MRQTDEIAPNPPGVRSRLTGPLRVFATASGIDWLRLLAHSGSLAPLALLLWDIALDQLSFNPIQDITFRTGRTALVLLVLSLVCTPANTVFGFRRALTVRRALGLYACLYAGLHFLTFTVLDYGLDLELIGETIAEKRYVLVGLAAFLILLPMALTSTTGWMRRLGQRWKLLHKLVYLAAPLAVVHFLWLVKADIREPLNFGAVVALLLTLRIPRVRKALVRLRTRLKGMSTNASLDAQRSRTLRLSKKVTPET
ncbi:MAG TPA: protein-methionine-sulfoxide reductase heme-binding subunit MsrQ [Anaerolineae bacterium]|nr:protein-methionine-sulfoxide reductase heme-binding subunit MsrQ [Anaerolineae bacterium]